MLHHNTQAPDIDVAEEREALRENTRFLLRVKHDDLQGSEDYSTAEIYELLRAFNAEQAFPLSDEDFTHDWADLLTPPPEPETEPEPTVDLAALLADAIAKKDIAALFTNEVIGYLATMKRLSGSAYAITENHIKEMFGKALNKSTFNQVVKEAVHRQVLSETGEKKDVATIAEEWARSHLDVWAYDEQYQCWRMFNDECWEVQADKGSFLDRYAVAAIQEGGHAVNTSGVLALFQRAASGHCTRRFTPPANKVNFANGTLNTETMQLGRHDKDDNFTYCLPYSYNPYATCPRILAFLRSVIGEFHEGQFTTNEHGVQTFMAHVGLALLSDTDMQKAIIALGVPGSGKSTLLDLVNMTCGLKAKQYVPHDIFSRELEGKRSRYIHSQKRVACIDEVPPEAFEDEETAKQLISHSGASQRGMYKEDQEDNQWRPKLFLVANDDPHYKDISGAIKRRLLILRCPVQRHDEPRDGRPVQDPILLKKLEPELGAFAAWCIRLALVVHERGYYPQSASMKCDLDQLANAGNPLKVCLAEKFILDPDEHTLTSELHTVYENFCTSDMGKNVKPLGSPKFASALCGMGKGISAKKKKGQRALLGIRLRRDTELIPPEETYEGSALLIEAERLNGKMDGWDGWDGCMTPKNSSRQCHEPAPQAPSHPIETAETANSNISSIESSNTHDSVYYSDIYKSNYSKLPSQPSHTTLEPLHKPLDAIDGTEKQSSTPVSQSSSRPHGMCEICKERDADGEGPWKGGVEWCTECKEKERARMTQKR